jgi:hypothetical protein
MKKGMGKIIVLAIALMLLVGLLVACSATPIEGATFSDRTVTYNGQNQTILVANAPAGVQVAYTMNGVTFSGATNVGVYEVTATLTGDKFATLTLTATLTIQKADITGVSFADSEVVFNGGNQTIAVANVPAGVTVVYEHNDAEFSGRTNVGTYPVTATLSGANYNTLKLEADFTIKRANIAGVTFNNATFAFNNTTRNIKIGGAALPAGTSVAYTIANGDAFNGASALGEYKVIATITGANHNTLVLNATLNITLNDVGKAFFFGIAPESYEFIRLKAEYLWVLTGDRVDRDVLNALVNLIGTSGYSVDDHEDEFRSVFSPLLILAICEEGNIDIELFSRTPGRRERYILVPDYGTDVLAIVGVLTAEIGEATEVEPISPEEHNWKFTFSEGVDKQILAALNARNFFFDGVDPVFGSCDCVTCDEDAISIVFFTEGNYFEVRICDGDGEWEIVMFRHFELGEPQVNGNVVSWNAVEDAEYYMVNVLDATFDPVTSFKVESGTSFNLAEFFAAEGLDFGSAIIQVEAFDGDDASLGKSYWVAFDQYTPNAEMLTLDVVDMELVFADAVYKFNNEKIFLFRFELTEDATLDFVGGGAAFVLFADENFQNEYLSGFSGEIALEKGTWFLVVRANGETEATISITFLVD